VKNIFKISAFAALLFCAAAVYAQSNDYKACRCRQWNGSNLSTLGVTLNDCCSLKQSGYSVGSYFSGSGTTVGSQSGANVTCGVTSGTISISGVNTSSHLGYYGATGTQPGVVPPADCSSYVSACSASFSAAYTPCTAGYTTGQSCTPSSFYSPKGQCIQGTSVMASSVAYLRCGSNSGPDCTTTGSGPGACSSCASFIYAYYNCVCVLTGNLITCS